MGVGVSSKGVSMALRGKYLVIFIYLTHLWTSVCNPKGNICTQRGVTLQFFLIALIDTFIEVVVSVQGGYT